MNALPKKVLVVDDDPVVGRSFDRVLSEKGYVVSTALDGQEALAKLGHEEYDVVFTDIRMPGMDGLEVANRIKERRPWIPVVIITGYGTAANQAQAAAAGVAGFIHKPLSPEMIEDGARRALQVIEGGKGKEVAVEAAAVEMPVPAAALATPTPAAPEALTVTRVVKNVALFLAAPFIGLVYAIAFPFIGLGLLARMGVRAITKRAESK